MRLAFCVTALRRMELRPSIVVVMVYARRLAQKQHALQQNANAIQVGLDRNAKQQVRFIEKTLNPIQCGPFFNYKQFCSR